MVILKIKGIYMFVPFLSIERLNELVSDFSH